MAKVQLGTELKNTSVRLKFRQGETKIISLLELDVDVIRIHYKDKNTYLCYQEQGLPCPFCKEGEFRYKLGVNVLSYNTKIENGQFMFDGTYDFKIWTFGQEAYQDLYRLKKSWPLESHDLEVTCTNETFQNISIQVRPECIWKKGSVGDPAQILALYASNKKDVCKYMMAQVTLPGQAPRGRRTGAIGAADPAARPSVMSVAPAITPSTQPFVPPAASVGADDLGNLLDSL